MPTIRPDPGSFAFSYQYSRQLMRSPALVDFSDQAGRARRLVIHLAPRAAIPLFEQVRAQLSAMVAVGHLSPGCRLPTVRDLASQLDLARGTTARAYRELERDGVTEGRGGRGTFVVDEPPHFDPLEERRQRVAQQRGGAPGPRPRLSSEAESERFPTSPAT